MSARNARAIEPSSYAAPHPCSPCPGPRVNTASACCARSVGGRPLPSYGLGETRADGPSKPFAAHAREGPDDHPIDRQTRNYRRRTGPIAVSPSWLAFGLLVMAILAPFAQFGVLQTLIVPADAAATTANIADSLGPFRCRDCRVRGRRYPRHRGRVGPVRRPSSGEPARRPSGHRVAGDRYAAAFAYALLNLVGVAQLVQGASAETACPGPAPAQVASRSRLRYGWDVALAIFGLHLVGLGGLLYRSTDFPRFLGARDPCRRRVPRRLVPADLRPWLHLDHQHLHVRG